MRVGQIKLKFLFYTSRSKYMNLGSNSGGRNMDSAYVINTEQISACLTSYLVPFTMNGKIVLISVLQRIIIKLSCQTYDKIN